MDMVQKVSICNGNVSSSEPNRESAVGVNKQIYYKDLSLLEYDKVVPFKWFLTFQRIMLPSSTRVFIVIIFSRQKLGASSTIKYCAWLPQMYTDIALILFHVKIQVLGDANISACKFSSVFQSIIVPSSSG